MLSPSAFSSLSRRSVLAAGAATALASAARGRPAFEAASGGRPPEKPEKQPPAHDAGRTDPNNPAVGKPVSETAAAQGGEPKVPPPPKPKVGFALVGLGKLTVGELLPAFNLSREGEVGALVTGDRDKGRAFARVLGIDESRVVSYEEMSRLREFEDVRAAYIVTPNHRHRRDTEAAAGAGLHVLCEKPMATNPEDCRAMMAACERAQRRLMIAYRVHYEPLNARVREMLKERVHGQPHFVSFDAVQDVGEAPQYRLDRERNGGGSLFDLGIYPLNTTRYLLREEPVEVSAMQWSDPRDPRFKEIEQNIAFQLRFPSGCIASCTSSFGTQRVNRYKIMCADGWLGMDPATSYRGLKASHGDDKGTHEMKLEEINQFAAEIDHFARCVREDKEPDTPGPEGLRDVNLMLAIYRAARERRAIKVGDDGAAVD